MRTAAVIGSGSWGTAFATHLAGLGFDTVLMARRRELSDKLRRHATNPEYLQVLTLPEALAYDCYAEADLSGFDLVVLAVPSRFYRSVLRTIKERLSARVCVLSLSKGLDPDSCMRLSRVAEDELQSLRPSIAVLSGPNHAEEVAFGQPSATVVSSVDMEYARRLQQLLSDEHLRVYANADLVGVELAAAVKNVIALAAGMSDGLGYGDNARAAVVTRGLAEMSRFGTALGAQARTFSGLSGLGDLVATCTSRHSRNRLAGELLAQGYTPAQVEHEIHMVVESLTVAPLVLRLAGDASVAMPITENVAAVLAEGKSVEQCVNDLMSRAPRDEDW
jgi:glycerol-3-phosphate dehydrogenase (NAD(P)+)